MNEYGTTMGGQGRKYFIPTLAERMNRVGMPGCDGARIWPREVMRIVQTPSCHAWLAAVPDPVHRRIVAAAEVARKVYDDDMIDVPFEELLAAGMAVEIRSFVSRVPIPKVGDLV